MSEKNVALMLVKYKKAKKNVWKQGIFGTKFTGCFNFQKHELNL